MTEKKFAFGDYLDDPTIQIVGGGINVEDQTPRQKRLEEQRWARKLERDKKESKMFDKLHNLVSQGVELSDEAKIWLEKKKQSDPTAVERLNVKTLAKKSLDPDNWASELMSAAQGGSSARFSSMGTRSAEDLLKAGTVGLVTYQDYKRKREEAEALEKSGGGGGGG
eukprot:CAMPEP_0113670058 /NCGR_PEP_ID=MMETSP0038_2-20120614/4923_1 /TAXON_ID=2898 /ORGANISM="Cryptomonas paramecium" /LENGTH=166 /DNA_ID=CAMNT_0000586027 /DNA_START=131 /DNA_END=627 /DNA_ORIENTATION=+ /assembly_acc=CAM_ASM_000170